MFEEIRRKLMTRTVDIVKFVGTWICDIAPMARLMLEENKEKFRACKSCFGMPILGLRLEKGSIGIQST